MRVSFFGRGHQNTGIEEDFHGLALQYGFEPFLTYLLKNAIPVCARLGNSPMDPQPIKFHQCRPFLDGA